MQSFIAFDVETPNHRNDRISAVGVTVIQNGEITQSFGTLVNPETYFDAFNVYLTGITPEMVRHAPTFDEVWEGIGRAFSENILIAHNAPFDLRVLSCCLTDYHLPHPEFLRCACTCSMAKRFYPHLPHHGLHDMCAYFQIPLDHHKADSDALACAKLLLNYIHSGREIAPFFRKYDVINKKTLRL